jgi:hypothetical protein
MKDKVLVYIKRKKEFISKVTCAFENFIGAQLPWGQFTTGL